MTSGYFRYPTIHAESVVFVCEDDLWAVPVSGGMARRLTSNLGEVTHPFFSPDGSQLSFVGREDGQPELYLMPAQGGPAQRLTFLGGSLVSNAGWTHDGKVVFANNARQPFFRMLHLYTVDIAGNPPQRLKLGPARSIAYGPKGAVVLGRNTDDPARWKRYRGGTAGQLWIDPIGHGEFHPLIQLKGNLASPMWIGRRIYFLSDHEGVGNLYSCRPDGKGLRRHTHHTDFYARNASTDGKRIVYHAGADLFVYDPVADQSQLIPVEFFSPQTQRRRRFVDPERYLNSTDLHPHGHALALSIRSQIYTFTNWEGAVFQHGDPAAGIRYRLPTWLNDGKRLVAITDEGGEESFVILTADGSTLPVQLPAMDIGRPEAIAANSQKNQIIFSNHRYEIIFLDLDTRELKVIDKGVSAPISGFDWSPDGEWVVYSVSISFQRIGLKLWKVATGEIFPLTDPVLRDVAPSFDPAGYCIYFLSYRTFDPVTDNIGFDLGFPRGVRPYLITLRNDLQSPFIPRSRFMADEKDEKDEKPKDAEHVQVDALPPAEPAAEGQPVSIAEGTTETPKEEPKAEKEEQKIQIDLDGIQQRIVAFPTKEGRYGRVMGAAEGKVFYIIYPIEGTLADVPLAAESNHRGSLLCYDFEERKEDVFLSGVTDFSVSRDAKSLLIRSGSSLRVLKINAKPNGDDTPGRKSGWIDLHRVRVPVVPGAEWRQMFREAWRLQRDQFWTPDMSQVDWVSIYSRYQPLVDRVNSRSEFSDLIWELQGELATSHAYEISGDYRPGPIYPQGSLGADFEYEAEADGWRITHIVQGDGWEDGADSPLNQVGLQIREGDVLESINGRRLGKNLSPAEALVNLARVEVTLTFTAKKDAPPVKPEETPAGEKKTPAEPNAITVRTLSSESPARYREWVETNRSYVHKATLGQVGYIHIPDMQSWGYSEFHRGYLSEIDHPALIVDVRYNRGGYVSSLLLEKLARRRIGYDVNRWGQIPAPYPAESVMGPMVALSNEYSASDGDIFSHGFKLMGLGPLIGKRTWGGVIGIWPRHSLVDGTITTQPEFSSWFKDVGWGVENYGTDPDIDVDITPQDYAKGIDAQLECAIVEIQRLLAENPPKLPDFSQKPAQPLPKLPK